MKKILVAAVMLTAAVVSAAETQAVPAKSEAEAKAPAKVACENDCKDKKCAAKGKKKLTKKCAIAIALKHAGLERANVRDLKCEVDREDGIKIFEVEFESGSHDYEYDIDAKTGKILKSKKELD